MSYWRQYGHGMLSRDAVCRLLELVDKAIEAKNTKRNVIDPEDIKKSWKVGRLIKMMVIIRFWIFLNLQDSKVVPDLEEVV